MSVHLANVTHPIFVFVLPMWAAPIICGGLLMECWIARRRFELRWRSVFFAVFVVNVFSAMLALPLLFVGTETLGRIADSLDLHLTHGTNDLTGLLSWAAAYIMATVINTGVETALLIHYWKVSPSMHPFRWWFLANGASNGLAFAAMLVLLLR